MSAEIVQALGSILGPENAVAMEARSARTSRALFSSVVDDRTHYACVARPADEEQLQRAVQFAAAHDLGVSVQPNAAGNGAMLAEEGREAIVLDLQRMNRIVEVSVAGAYALVEPGVSYLQLHQHLQGNGLAFWVDCDRDPRNSIVGSICARHIGYTPYADHLQMQCGFEAVLSNGTLLRTGMGALPKSTTWQLFKYNFGPYLDGVLTHTNFATISKAGLWLMPAPAHYLPFMVSLADESSLGKAIETLRPLMISGTLPGAVRIGDRPFELSPHGPAAARQSAPGTWNIFGALYGTEDIAQVLWEVVREALGSIDRAQILPDPDRPGDPVWKMRRTLMRGAPLPRNFALQRKNGVRYMRLTSVIPMEGEAALNAGRLVKQAGAQSKLDLLCEYTLLARTMLLDVHVPYTSAQDASAAASVVALDLVRRFAAAGFGIVDESLELRRVLDRHFADSPLTRFTRRLSTAFAM